MIALLISILAGPKFIEFLRRKELGQHIREEGPEHHVSKQGTPTMGGLLILFAAAIGFLAFSRYTVPALTVLFVTLACGAIGFLDDFIKLTHRRSLGLNGRWKLILLGADHGRASGSRRSTSTCRRASTSRASATSSSRTRGTGCSSS